jgi:N-acetylglucosaminyl-diphospho-decaprenol L-rhamnosyltransferase
MSRVAAVIITYQSADVVGAAIASCIEANCEVVVIDNASNDGISALAAQYPSARWIMNPRNRGFAGAVNQGFELTTTPLVLLLNPDAVIDRGLDHLIAACQIPGVGAAAGQLCDANGHPQSGFSVRRLPTPLTLAFEALGLNRLWPGNPVNRHYRCIDLDHTAASDVEQPAGAFLLIKRDAWAKVGGFDERFHPVWFEDVDFCKRLHDAGFRIRFEPRASARHIGGHSAGKLPLSTKELHWYASLQEYVRKHYSRWQLAAVSLAVAWGAVPRMVIGIFRVRNLSPVSTYAKVIRLACRYLFLGGSGVRSRAEINN